MDMREHSAMTEASPGERSRRGGPRFRSSAGRGAGSQFSAAAIGFARVRAPCCGAVAQGWPWRPPCSPSWRRSCWVYGWLGGAGRGAA